jgi:hypothetical protein
MSKPGAPLGNTNGRKGKDWFDAIRKECVQREALPKIAKKVVDMALEGEQWAIQEIGNRLDGKPAQAVEVSGPDGEALAVRDATAEALDARIAELSAKLAAWGA